MLLVVVAAVVVPGAVLVDPVGAVEVVDEERGAGMGVDEVPLEVPLPVEDGLLGLLIFDGSGIFVRVVPMTCGEPFGCFVGAGTRLKTAADPEAVPSGAR